MTIIASLLRSAELPDSPTARAIAAELARDNAVHAQPKSQGLLRYLRTTYRDAWRAAWRDYGPAWSRRRRLLTLLLASLALALLVAGVGLALLDAINKHNEREPTKRVIFLNYSAVDPTLTNEKCSFWHFRYDAHADMRMAALMDNIKEDKALKTVYLIGQDYSFGQSVLKEAKRQLGMQRPDVNIAGEELHPMARVKDFLPYAVKIKASGAQAVITGNWGNLPDRRCRSRLPAWGGRSRCWGRASK